MSTEKLEFLLGLLVGKIIEKEGVKDPVNFILYYMLDLETAVAVQDEVIKIDGEVKRGEDIKNIDVCDRIGKFYRGGGSGGPALFISYAFKVFAPDIYKTLHPSFPD